MIYKEDLGGRIKNGEVGVLPTDTLYGLVGSALMPDVVQRIYSLKGRDIAKPFIVLIADIKDLAKFKVVVSGETRAVLDKLWPGPASVILPCGSGFEYIHRGSNKIAFRLPAKEDLRRLISESGPVVAPSANPEGLPPAKNISEAKKYFGDRVDFYEDHGERHGAPSTLVELNDGVLKVIRPGAAKINL